MVELYGLPAGATNIRIVGDMVYYDIPAEPSLGVFVSDWGAYQKQVGSYSMPLSQAQQSPPPLQSPPMVSPGLPQFNEEVQATSPEGIVQTNVRSYTPSQWEIRQNIIKQGGTMTPQAEEQLALGLQQQTREALAGKTPQTFTFETPESSWDISSGITPNMLAGAVGSTIPKGFMQTELGQIIPQEQQFEIETAEGGIMTKSTFTAVPIASAVGGGFLWKTPYGEIRAEPEFLGKEIGRAFDVQASFKSGKEYLGFLSEQEHIEELGIRPLVRSAWAITHPIEAIETLVGMAVVGKPEGAEFFKVKPKEWMKDMNINIGMWARPIEEAGPAKFTETFLTTTAPTAAFEYGMIMFPYGDVLGKIGGLAGRITSPLGQSIIRTATPALKGVALGIGLGVTTIGSVEMGKGAFEEKGISGLKRTIRGAEFTLLGAGITKGVWSKVHVPAKEMPISKKYTLTSTDLEETAFKISEEEGLVEVGGEIKGQFGVRRPRTFTGEVDFSSIYTKGEGTEISGMTTAGGEGMFTKTPRKGTVSFGEGILTVEYPRVYKLQGPSFWISKWLGQPTTFEKGTRIISIPIYGEAFGFQVDKATTKFYGAGKEIVGGAVEEGLRGITQVSGKIKTQVWVGEQPVESIFAGKGGKVSIGRDESIYYGKVQGIFGNIKTQYKTFGEPTIDTEKWAWDISNAPREVKPPITPLSRTFPKIESPPSWLSDLAGAVKQDIMERQVTKTDVTSIVGITAGLGKVTNIKPTIESKVSSSIIPIFMGHNVQTTTPKEFEWTLTQQKPIVKRIEKTGTLPSIITQQKPSVIQIQKEKIGLKPFTPSGLDIGIKTNIGERTGFIPLTTSIIGTTQVTKLEQEQKVTTIGKTIPGIVPIITPIPKPIITNITGGGLFGFSVPAGSGGHKRMKPFKISGFQKTRYEPSLGGVFRFAKPLSRAPKKSFTGLEIRPIILPSSGRKSRRLSKTKIRGFKVARKRHRKK